MAAIAPPSARFALRGLELDRLTERETISCVMSALDRGDGGWIVTLNVDILRGSLADAELRRLVAEASLAVADGMPLVWASRAAHAALPERVTGASLIGTLAEEAARHERSIYLLGGEPGVAERAAAALCRRAPGLVVAGCDSPELGFERDRAKLEAVRDRVVGAQPDIVFVGLGFPKQEQLIEYVSPSMPHTWFVACGAAIPFAAGSIARAPEWMQQSGLEWLHRLVNEPRRLFSRYVFHDIPFAARLLGGVLLARAAGALRSETPQMTPVDNAMAGPTLIQPAPATASPTARRHEGHRPAA